MAAQRFRLKFMFWLDVTKADDYALAEQIEELKYQRRFTQTIRDGIRLICDLRRGKLDVLFELFPWVRAEFLATIEPVEARSPSLEDQLKRLEALMLRQGFAPLDALPSGAPQRSPAPPAGPKAMTVPQFAAPAFDDEDDLVQVVVRPDAGANAAQNFVNSALSLLQ